MNTDGPLFDSTHAALKFALNYSSGIPSPLMNRMAADGKLQRVQLESGERVTVGVGMRMRRPKRPSLRGLDGAAQAAMIAQELNHLDEAQKHSIIAAFKQWVLPCACRSPCCMGFRRNPGWVASITALCEILKNEAQLSRVRGKKGLSTHPLMRQALVERFFIPEKPMVLADLAEKCNVTPATVIAHKKPIEQYLSEQQSLGLREIDQTLSLLGIVGSFD